MASTTIPIITAPPTAPHTHTIVFLHGRGDNALNFSSSLSYSLDSRGRTLIEAFPSIRWVFPEAPLRKCASLPDTMRQWFDTWDVRNLHEREELQAPGLKEVVPAIRDILAQEAELLGGRWDRLVLAGISMGAATGAHVLFNLDVPSSSLSAIRKKGLGGFLGFSGRCPFVGRSLTEMREVLALEGAAQGPSVLENTPVFLEHCVDDPLVNIHNGRALRDTLRQFGAPVVWKEYSGGGHWFNSPEGIDDAVGFLNGVLEKTNAS